MNKKAIYEHMLNALENYEIGLTFEGFCGLLWSALLKVNHNIDFDRSTNIIDTTATEAELNYMKASLQYGESNDFPELMNHKPEKPWSSIWWFHPNDHQVRIDILKTILKDMA